MQLMICFGELQIFMVMSLLQLLIFMQMGLPRVLLSDNGSEFCNALNDQLSEMLGINYTLPPSGLFNECYCVVYK